nr:molybdopterin cofactor-binding domain-containing protein [Streptomyces noursei]
MVELEEEWRHRPTEAFDLTTGQGNGHVQYSFAAHRAVVEVDTELGLVKVIELACAQDVGKALNPLSVIGQIQGGTTQGLGVAVMEEIIVDPKDREGAQPLLHGLSDPHHPRHPDHPGRCARTRRPARPVRAARHRRGPHPVVHPGRPRGDPERDRAGAQQDPGTARAPDGFVTENRLGAASPGPRSSGRCAARGAPVRPPSRTARSLPAPSPG